MARKPALSPASDEATGTTRASAVYDALRTVIMDGVLAPDTKLRVDALAKRYAVGASPVREALNRLSAEGWVSRSDQRGFQVASLRWEDLAVLTETRCQVESLALRESMAARTPEWEEALVLLVHKLARTPRSLSQEQHVPNPQWEALHRDFHAGLLANCPSRWLREFCATLTAEAYRYRQIAASRNFTQRHEHGEHQALFLAAIEGRTELAVQLLTEHYRKTSVSVAAHAPQERIG